MGRGFQGAKRRPTQSEEQKEPRPAPRLELLGFRVKAPFQWFSRNVFYSSSTCLFACPYILLFVLGARGHLSFIQGLAKYSLVMLIGLFKADKSGDTFWLGGQVGDKLETSLETSLAAGLETSWKYGLPLL